MVQSTQPKQLNAEQLQAARHLQGPCLVVAAAGSGKTAMLIERIGYLVTSGVSPNRILVCTFTKKATAEMKQRTEASLGSISKQVTISTLHGVAYQMVKDRFGDDFKVLSDPAWVIERILRPYHAQHNVFGVGPLLDAVLVRRQIALAKGAGATPDHQGDSRLRRVFAAYEAYKENHHLLDFEDLLIQALSSMQTNPGFLKRWQARWEYIMVDEFQDTNRVQWNLIQSLVQSTGNLLVAGDDCQSIYEFRGARPALMREFLRVYPHATKIMMTINYRNHDVILALAERVIALNEGHHIQREVTASREASVRAIAQAIMCTTDVDEATWLASELAEMRAQYPQIPWHQYAILYRTNTQSRLYEEALVKARIPYEIVADRHFYEIAAIKTVLDYLRAAEHPQAKDLIVGLLNKPSRGISRDVIAAVAAGGWDALVQEETCADFVDVIDGLRRHVRPAEAILWLVRRLPLLIRQTDEAGPIRGLDALVQAAQQHETQASFLQYVDSMLMHGQEFNKGDAVQMMTIHQSKGLEFETVFIAGMVEGLLPYQRAIDEGDIREETRLCYVAMTRAKENVYLLAAQVYGGRKLARSRYLEALLPE